SRDRPSSWMVGYEHEHEIPADPRRARAGDLRAARREPPPARRGARSAVDLQPRARRARDRLLRAVAVDRRAPAAVARRRHAAVAPRRPRRRRRGRDRDPRPPRRAGARGARGAPPRDAARLVVPGRRRARARDAADADRDAGRAQRERRVRDPARVAAVLPELRRLLRGAARDLLVGVLRDRARVRPRRADRGGAMTHPATERYARHVNPALVKLLGMFGYGRVFTRALGVELWDSEGRRYVDLLAAFGAAGLGHNPRRLVDRMREALSEELCHLMHVGPQALAGELGEALARRLPALPIMLPSLSGGEAVEAAIKLARAATGRAMIVSCEGGFHGTGLGNLSVMGHRRWRAPFEPLLPECRRVPFGDLRALERVLEKHRVAALLLEPIQAEAGVVLPPEGYLREAQALCRRHGALLVLDEVQTGLGRTGRWFAFEHAPGLDPDVVVLGKTLGGALIPVAVT